jgi:hypothetical protein
VTKCNLPTVSFPSCKRRTVAAHFGGGSVSSDGGVLLLRQADRRLGLTAGVASLLEDRRRQASCQHETLSLLRQRVYALALGYEDLNDHATLRTDPGLQTAVERDEALASSPTLCRWENQADRETAWAIHRELVAQFIASYKHPPRRLILDFDATDDAVHGSQEGRFFHGYYGQYCFLPLYVFCGSRLLVSYLRPSSTDPARHVWAILALLVKRLRQAWPGVEIIFRGDSAFCRWRMLRWCEQHQVGYLVGLAKNSRVQAAAADLMEEARVAFAATGQKQRRFADVVYAALPWDQPRRVIAKAEHGSQGSNPRFVVTNLEGDAQTLYDDVYCARGEMENRIKEQQLDLFADRTSCHRWWPNQFRLLLSSLAYTLLEAIRRLALQGTELARAQCGTIRLKLLKIGAVVVRNTRRVRLILSSGYPLQALFFQTVTRLASG